MDIALFFEIRMRGESMAAKSLEELKSQIEVAIGDSLNGDVIEFIQQKLVDHAQTDVYDVYKPRMYGRRYSLLQKDEYLIETGANMHLVITPVQKFNPCTTNGPSRNTGEELAGLINYGDVSYKGYGYDYYGGSAYAEPTYLEPRPFLDNTVDELAAGELADSLWASLKKHGYNVK